MPGTLDGNRQTIDTIPAKLETNGGFDSLEYSPAGFRRRVASSMPALLWQSAHVLRPACNGLHNIDRHTDIFRGHVVAIELLDEFTKFFIQ